VWGSECITPHILISGLRGGEWSASAPSPLLYPPTRWIGGWWALKPVCTLWRWENFLLLPGVERPACRPSVYRLSYSRFLLPPPPPPPPPPLLLLLILPRLRLLLLQVKLRRRTGSLRHQKGPNPGHLIGPIEPAYPLRPRDVHSLVRDTEAGYPDLLFFCGFPRFPRQMSGLCFKIGHGLPPSSLFTTLRTMRCYIVLRSDVVLWETVNKQHWSLLWRCSMFPVR
jgi:hypothetical protein